MSDTIQKWLYRKPANREQLAAWTEAFLGYKVTQTTRCSDHSSQLDYLESAFFNLHSACVFMASRNGGKSLTAAATCILDAHFKPKIKIAVAGYIAEHSQYICKYIYQFLDHFESLIGKKLVANRSNAANVKEIQFTNGSLIKFFSGGKSEADVSGFRPNVLFVDEADKFPIEKYDGISNALEGGGDFPSRFDTLSTNYTVTGDGVILKQIEKYQEFNLLKPEHMLPKKIFKICLLDILANCDDRYQCHTCPLMPYCKGKAKKVQGDGYFRIEEAISKAIDNSRPTFEAQYLLLRPTSEFSYYPEFSIGEHVLDEEKELNPLLLTLIAFDFGGGRCPHACVIIQKDIEKGIYYVIDEFQASCSLESFCELVKSRYPKIVDADCFYDPAGNRKEHLRESKSHSEVLKRQGFFPRCKQLKRRQTFELVHSLIAPAVGKPKLLLNKRCKNLIRQIQEAEHETIHGKPTAEPKDGFGDDLHDCLRYIIGWTCGTYAKHLGSKHMRFF